MIYLDNAATTAVTTDVAEAMLPFLYTNFANPSAQYSIARQARLAIEKARKQVADAINAEPNQIFFTSGATESNNIVMRAFDHTICSNIEHPSIMGIEFNVFDDYLSENLDRLISEFTSAKSGKRTVISCQWVNNETGIVLPVGTVCATAHHYGLPFHTDATQAFGHIKIDVKALDCDFLSLSGHKFHAPKGVGVLYIKEPKKFKSDIVGGGQEKGIRSGTENVAGIVGIGKAAELYKYTKEREQEVGKMRLKLIDLLSDKLTRSAIFNSKIPNIPNIMSLSIQGVEGESLLLLLDNKDICVSGGSACHSGQNTKSKTLTAMGVPDDYIYGTIRISMDAETNTLDDITKFVEALTEILKVI